MDFNFKLSVLFLAFQIMTNSDNLFQVLKLSPAFQICGIASYSLLRGTTQPQ